MSGIEASEKSCKRRGRLFEKGFPPSSFKNFSIKHGAPFFSKSVSNNSHAVFFLIVSILIHIVVIFSGVFNLSEALGSKEEIDSLIVLQEFQAGNFAPQNSMASVLPKTSVHRGSQRIEKPKKSIISRTSQLESASAPRELEAVPREVPNETAPLSAQPATVKAADSSSITGDSGDAQVPAGEAGEGRLSSPDGGGAAKVRSDWKKSYRRQVYSRIARAKKYPYSARRAGMEGKVVVSFTISRDGGLISVSVVKPCSYPLLNSDALEWVRRAAPFPPFPPEADESSMSFTYGLRYELTEP